MSLGGAVLSLLEPILNVMKGVVVAVLSLLESNFRVRGWPRKPRCCGCCCAEAAGVTSQGEMDV